MPALFTFVVAYDGGTYVSQIEAENVDTALLKWCDKFAESEDIPKKTRKLAKVVRDDAIQFNFLPVALDGVSQVWCAYTSWRKHASINIVKTAKV